MSLGDVTILNEAAFGNPGTRRYQVVAGTAASINGGEPTIKPLGTRYVATLATNTPQITTTFFAGIAQSRASTETASADGVVDVLRPTPGIIYLCKANSAVTITTQAQYNALVGARVLFDKTGGVYTVLGTDNAFNGLVIEDLDITKYPGMIAFTVRNAANYFN